MKFILATFLSIFIYSCTIFKNEENITPNEEIKIDSTWATKYKFNSLVEMNEETLLFDVYLKDETQKLILDYRNLISFKTTVMSYKNKMCKTELYFNAKNIKPFLDKHRKAIQGLFGNEADIGLMILSGNSRPLGNFNLSFFENRETKQYTFINITKFNKEYINLSEICNYGENWGDACNSGITPFYAEIINEMKIPLKFGVFIFSNYSKGEGFYSPQKEIVFEPTKF